MAERPLSIRPVQQASVTPPASPLVAEATQSRTLTHLSDADLVALAQGGATDGITLLYERHRLWVYRFLLANLGNQQNAEDATQDVFVKVLHKLNTFKGDAGTFSGWLFRIARNTLTDQLRSSQRSRQVTFPTSDQGTDPAGVEQLAEQHVLIQQISREIAELTPAQREVMALRFGAGLAVKETAILLGKAEGTVKALQFQALQALRKRTEG